MQFIHVMAKLNFQHHSASRDPSEIIIFHHYNITHVFSVTFDQLNQFLLNNNINFINFFKYLKISGLALNKYTLKTSKHGFCCSFFNS